MKNILILLLTVCSFALNAQVPSNVQSIKPGIAQPQRAATDFEGIVKITDTQKIGFSGEYKVRGHQIASKILLDNDKTLRKIIDNTEKTVVTLKKEKGKKVAIKTLKTPAERRPAGKINLSVSKATKKIGDYECTKVVADDTYTKFEAWVAPGLNIYLGDLLSTENGLAILNKMTSKNGVEGTILEMTRTDIAKGTKTKMSVSVEAKKIKDKAFKIPKGYKLVDRTRKPGRARSMPTATSFKGVTDRAYEIQKKVRAGQMGAPKDGKQPAKEAAPATPKKEK